MLSKYCFEFQMDQNHLQAENIEHVFHRNRYRNHRRRSLIIKKLSTKQVGIKIANLQSPTDI